MIQRLRLRNWRAYDNLDLELGPGATFIVASNGIGKTSLIMAAAWGLFGDVSGINGVHEIRGDTENASVTLDLRLPSLGEASITRDVDRGGHSNVEVRFGETTLRSQSEIDALFVGEFGADAHVLSQLTFMIHGGLLETKGEFNLQNHLAKVFGVSSLIEAGSAAERLVAETSSALRKMKNVQRSDRRQREQLVGELEEIGRASSSAEAAREIAIARMNAESAIVARAKEWERFQQAMRERAEQLQDLARIAGELLGESIAPNEILVRLSQRETELEVALAGSDANSASVAARIELVEEALAQLRTTGSVCPTCLRPMSTHESTAAEEQHSRHLGSLKSTLENAARQAGAERSTLNEVRRLLRKVQSLPAPIEPSGGSAFASTKYAEEQLSTAQTEVQRFDRELAERRLSRETVQGALLALDEEERQARELAVLYSREAVATAAVETFRATAAAVTERLIEPLVADVARRWKMVFGDGGLHLSSSGRITREIGSRVLPFEALSGGEKVWALLLTRLLMAGASTRAPFVWLDEPLEHLDPRLRKVVAGTLALASSGVGLRQIVVTTYETHLAQQLMEDVPSASLIFVTPSD